jgi:eukaryotic-like serine/threonine-protein kinase
MNLKQKRGETRRSPHQANRNPVTSLVVFIFCVLLAAYLLIRPNLNVVMFRADNQRSGDFSKFNSVRTGISWAKYKTYGYFISSPVIKDNIIYVGELNGNALRAIDMKSGSLVWSFIAEDDIPFSPAISGQTIYVTGSDGRLYALDKLSGKKKWEYRVENFYSMATSPTVYKDIVFFGSRDTYLYAVHASTGVLRWRYKTNGGIDTSPLVVQNTVIFGSFDGNIYALDVYTGREKWKFATGGKIIGSPAEKNGTIFFGSDDGYVYALRNNTGSLVWKTQTNGPIETPPTITKRGIIIANRNNMLYYLDGKRGTTIWAKEFPTEAYTSAAVKNNIIYIGSSDNALYAVREKDGSDIWKFQTEASIAAAPSISGNALFFTNRAGYVYAIDDRSGSPYVKNFTVSGAANSVDSHAIYELTIQYPSGGYQSPGLDASVSATFKHGDTESVIRGFYYDENTWKIRFVPDVVGEWSWEVKLTVSENTLGTKKGTFFVNPSDSEGFIRRDPLNGSILSLENGKVFHPLGLQTCFSDNNDDGYFLNSLYSDTKPVDLDTYVKIHGKSGSGFNIFRWGVQNCSFSLWRFPEDPRLRAPFLTREGMWADTIMKKLKENGFHVWFTLFWNTPMANESNPVTREKYIHTIDPYLDYIVARYGAYVDIWELLNETHATQEWINYVSGYIRSIDPYKHLITVSWERPELSNIDIDAPHWYDSNPLSVVDTKLAQYILYNDWGKPLIFGEFGNKGSNWGPGSLTRMRVQMWVSFFMNTGLFFWDTSETQTFKSNDNANIYLGPEERMAARTLRRYMDLIDTTIRPLKIAVSNPSVRSYAAASSDTYCGYLYHYAQQDMKISTNLFLPPLPWSRTIITWIDPQTGAIIKTHEISGSSTVTSPLFAVDIAYRIEEYNHK